MHVIVRTRNEGCKVKILLTSDWYEPVVNGVVTSVRNLKRELEKRESSGGKAAAPRSSDAVTRQRQATRQAVRPR